MCAFRAVRFAHFTPKRLAWGPGPRASVLASPSSITSTSGIGGWRKSSFRASHVQPLVKFHAPFRARVCEGGGKVAPKSQPENHIEDYGFTDAGRARKVVDAPLEPVHAGDTENRSTRADLGSVVLAEHLAKRKV